MASRRTKHPAPVLFGERMRLSAEALRKECTGRAIEVTRAQLHYMQHALGLDDYGQGSWYRNHFTAGPECDSWEALCQLVELGLMKRHEPRPLFGGDSCFVVTEEGKRYVRENSPPPPKLTRSAARYRRWLRSGADMPFGDWLKEARNG